MPRITYVEKVFSGEHDAIIARANTIEMRTILDEDAWRESQARRDEGRRVLSLVSGQWERVTGEL